MIKPTQHTQEPWVISDSGVAFYSANGEWIGVSTNAINPRNVEKGRANARRIVACVNACAGIATEKLENTRLHYARIDMDRLRVQSMAERDQLLAVLEVIATSSSESTALSLKQRAARAIAAAKGGAA